jgi:hypothetical protein
VPERRLQRPSAPRPPSRGWRHPLAWAAALALASAACGDSSGAGRADHGDTAADAPVDVPDDRAPSDGDPELPEGDAPLDADAPPDAWPDQAGDAADADLDGEPPAEAVVRIDWREARGEALPSRLVAEGAGLRAFAATPTGLVTQSRCDDGAACRFEWLDREGELGVVRDGWRFVHGAPVSHDAARLLAFAQAAHSTCRSDDAEHEIASGDVLLVELTTGQVQTVLAEVQTHLFDEPAFTDQDAWLRLMPMVDGRCGSADFQPREAAPPFSPSPLDDAVFWPLGELEDGRWFGLEAPNDDFGLRDPRDAGAPFVAIVAGAQAYRQAGGWIHAYGRWPTRQVGALAVDTGTIHTYTVPALDELYPERAWGRFTLLCGRLDLERESYPCRVHDMRGELPDRDVEVAALPRRRLALLGAIERLVYVARLESGRTAVERLDLRTGTSERLANGSSWLYELGDGEAVIALTPDREALLVESREPVTLAVDVEQVVTLEPPMVRARALPQGDLAFLLRVPFDHLDRPSLDVLDLRSRRLVTLTDRLAYNPTPGGPSHSEGCGLPWVARPAGFADATTRTPSGTLYFLEQPAAGAGPEATLWVMPADLGHPPRALTRMIYVYCRAPLVSVDGSHAVVAVERFDGSTEVWSADVSFP